jgi:hypothetical protein
MSVVLQADDSEAHVVRVHGFQSEGHIVSIGATFSDGTVVGGRTVQDSVKVEALGGSPYSPNGFSGASLSQDPITGAVTDISFQSNGHGRIKSMCLAYSKKGVLEGLTISSGQGKLTTLASPLVIPNVATEVGAVAAVMSTGTNSFDEDDPSSLLDSVMDSPYVPVRLKKLFEVDDPEWFSNTCVVISVVVVFVLVLCVLFYSFSRRRRRNRQRYQPNQRNHEDRSNYDYRD